MGSLILMKLMKANLATITGLMDTSLTNSNAKPWFLNPVSKERVLYNVAQTVRFGNIQHLLLT